MTKNSTPLKLGVIGCGYATENLHLPTLQSLPEAKVVGLADLNLSRLKTVADRFQIEHRYANFATLLRNPAVEAIAICVPPELHVEIALAGLDAGKHVFIEKPVALNLDDTDLLLERASKSPHKVMVGFNLRHHRHVREARKIIQHGVLGPLEFIRTVSSSRVRYQQNFPDWRKDRVRGGGVLIELAVHHFDLWRFLLGNDIEEVFAASRSADSDDLTATVTARMTNGVLATSMFSQCAAESNDVEIFGQDGRLLISFYRFDGLEFVPSSNYPGDIRSRLRKILRTIKQAPQAVSNAFQGGVYLSSYRSQWRDFINCIRQGSPVGCTLEDGRHALELALASIRSAALDRPVKVGDALRKDNEQATT
jgi:myo-inositol 2-dehydrogenase/D-chiro-inositol 1-dehydrogenase